MPRRRRKLHLLAGISLLVLLCAALLVAGPLVGRFVLSRLKERVTAERGGVLSVASFEADFFRGLFRFQDFTYREESPGQRAWEISAEEGEIDVSLGSLFADVLVVERLTLRRPGIVYRQQVAADRKKGAPLRSEIQLGKLFLEGGELFLEDLSHEEPVRLKLHIERFEGDSLSTHDPFSLCTRIFAAGTLGEEGAPFQIEGESAHEGDETKSASCRIEGLALPPLLPYFLYGLPIRATSGWLDGTITVRTTEEEKIAMRAELNFREVALDLGEGPWLFLAEKTGVPQAIKERGGSFSVVVLETFSSDEVHGYAGDFLRRFLGLAWQQALVTLTVTH